MTTALPEANWNQTPDEHMQISRRFIAHARAELARGERLQASEKIWGAAQHALAAVGKERGWDTEDYNHTRAIANHLSDEFGDEQIGKTHASYYLYHANFYRNGLDALDIAKAIDDVEKFVNEMQRIRERGPQPFKIRAQGQIDRLEQIAGHVPRRLRVGETYTDGFVDSYKLSEYREQWKAREAGGSADTPSAADGGAGRPDAPAAPPGPELAEARQALREVTAAAVEDGLEVPSPTAFANAERLLEAMYRISPRRFAVYPDYDGYITIDARGRNDNIAVVMCGSDGGALCLATIDNESRRARYATARDLPDGFIREALLALGEEPSR